MKFTLNNLLIFTSVIAIFIAGCVWSYQYGFHQGQNSLSEFTDIVNELEAARTGTGS